MSSIRLRNLTAATAAVMLLATVPVLGQSGDGKPPEQKRPAAAVDPAQERQRKIEEFSEAERNVEGAAGQPECVWLGRRIVALMWRDDLDTAFRHIELYDRFGCPGVHIQTTFRCLVRNGNIDPKVPESLANRIHACWVDPSLRPAAAVVSPPGGAAAPAAPSAR